MAPIPHRLGPIRSFRHRLAFALAALLAACATAPRLPLEARRQIFQEAWQTIGEKHFDPQMGGVDWAAVRARYAPQVDRAETEGEFLAVLQAMVAELRHSHVGVLPPDRGEVELGAGVAVTAPAAEATPAAATDPGADPSGAAAASRELGTTGLRVVWLDGKVVVAGVSAGSAAERAGVRPGEELLAVAGRPLAPVLATVGDHGGGVVPYAIAARLQGGVGTDVELQLAAAAGPPRTVTVTRERPEMPSMQLGNLGAVPAEFEARWLDGAVLYVRFTPCFVPLQERFEQALAAHRDAKGVILDLRDNPGGLGALAMGVARHFLREEQSLGSMRMRGAEEPLRFVVNPSPLPFAGPLVVLVNRSTGSTAEILAAGLQSLGRARVVGQTSMGAALPSVVEKIAHDWRVQAVVADFTLPDGSSVEGRGVVPDVAVQPTRADYAAGRDPFLQAALRELEHAPRLAAATAAPAVAAAAPSAAPLAPCVMDAPMRALFERICAQPWNQRLAAAKSVRVVARLEVMGMSGPNTTTILAPGRVHSLGTLPGTGELLQVCDGTRGWSRNSFEGLRELVGEELAVLRRSARLDASAWAEQFAKLELLEQKQDGDRECFVVRQTPREGEGQPVVLHIDAATLQTYRVAATVRSRMGATAVVTELSEFTDFDGVVVAKRSVAKVGGTKLTTVTERVELDVPVDAALFGEPQPVAPKAAPAGRK
ncbi:MAG: hypothetical protein JNK49_01515 [Planctomycetes bacterium]|nr:hypothetical protein [Planctomycetota bacterium]